MKPWHGKDGKRESDILLFKPRILTLGTQMAINLHQKSNLRFSHQVAPRTPNMIIVHCHHKDYSHHDASREVSIWLTLNPSYRRWWWLRTPHKLKPRHGKHGTGIWHTWKTARATNWSSFCVSWCHSLRSYKSAMLLYQSASSGCATLWLSKYLNAAMAAAQLFTAPCYATLTMGMMMVMVTVRCARLIDAHKTQTKP